MYHMPDKNIQSEMAYKSKMSFVGKHIKFNLFDKYGEIIPDKFLYKPKYINKCEKCGSRLICNGCSDYGKCKN